MSSEVTSQAPLCFILMPFGRKPNSDGTLIDFDRVYRDLIVPAVEQAGLEPLRADEESAGGIIHKPMFERLILCPYAVADLTLANPNVFYELGVRHAVRPWSTALIFAQGGRLPFDVHMLRTIMYTLDATGVPDAESLAAERGKIVNFLVKARNGVKDSPVYQLLDCIATPVVDHSKTDVFREEVRYSARLKEQLAAARKGGAQALMAAEQALGALDRVESGVVIDLFLSYRAVEAWAQMVVLVEKMPPPLQATVLVREQLAFAHNRMGERDRAERILLDLIAERGPSSETYGLLGRVYKDRWEEAQKAGNTTLARGLLDKAINAYLLGFEADWRDAYPGINATTLMELRDPPDPRREKILPVVRYAVERKIARGKPDYWDYATLVELAVLGKDEEHAGAALGKALAAVREPWEPKTTARNIRLIREARERRGESQPWMMQVEQELSR